MRVTYREKLPVFPTNHLLSMGAIQAKKDSSRAQKLIQIESIWCGPLASTTDSWNILVITSGKIACSTNPPGRP